MSVTSQFTTFSDLYIGVLNATRSQITQADPKSQAKRAVNMALYDMHLGTGPSLYWAEREAEILTLPPVIDGTISISQGSTTVTGSGTTWATSEWYGVPVERDGKIVPAGSQIPFTVTQVNSDTELILNKIFHLSDVSGVTYQYFKDTYMLDADYGRPVDMQFFDNNQEIRLVDRRQFRRMEPRNSTTGKPRMATQIELGPLSSTASRKRIILSPPPDAAYKLPYSYVTNKLAVSSIGTGQTALVEDDDEPIVPLQYRHAIYWYACKIMFQGKDDARRNEAAQEYNNIMTRILNDVNPGDNRIRVEPDIRAYASHAAAPYSGRGRVGRWSTNNRFDYR